MARILLSIGTLLLLLLPVAAQDRGPAGLPAKGELEYFREDLSTDPGVVAGSGRIHIRTADFELEIPDGGVVLWVDVERWKALRRETSRSEEDAGEERGGEKEDESAPRTAEDVLGPVIHELYAEGDVTLRRDDITVRASRMYYNFVRNRAVIVEAEVATELRSGKDGATRIPISIRAERIYQVVKDELRAGPARMTTCTYGHPHYELSMGYVTLTRDEENELTFTATNSVLRAFDVPVFWTPWLYGSTRTGLDPIRDATVGTSSKLGTYAGLTLGWPLKSLRGGKEKTWGDLEFELVHYQKRGPGIGTELVYADKVHQGKLVAFYQRDGKERDRVTLQQIDDPDRGRVRLQHRSLLSPDFFSGTLTGIGELSYVSDGSYLPEYYGREAREDKAQETAAYVSWLGEASAASLTGRWELNDFETTTEYRPRVWYDLLGAPVLTDLFGTGTDVHLAGEAGAAKVFRRFADDAGLRGVETNRFQARGAVSAPFSLGPVRIAPEFVAGMADYSGNQEETRGDLSAQVRASIDFWADYPGVDSASLDLSGLRHVVDVALTYGNRFAVTTPSSELFVQDPQDLLDEIEVFDLRVRNRLQTKRAGGIVDWVDWELRGLYFSESLRARPAPFGPREEFQAGMSSGLVPGEEWLRSIRRRGLGPITSDFRARVREDLFLVAGAWYDFETHEFETHHQGLRYEPGPDLSFFVGHRGIEGDSSILTAWADFTLTSRWSVRLLQQTNIRNGTEQTTGINLRRVFHDFVMQFQFRVNTRERTTSLSLTIEPTKLFDERRAERADEALDLDSMRWVR